MSKKQVKTVSEYLIEVLAEYGVGQIFGVAGDALNSVTDAIRRQDKIRWIGVRHEEAGAFAAGAQAQLTGKLGVCAGTVGPGAIHLLNGLYDAAKSGAPVLAITGQVPTSEIGTDYFQEVDLDGLFRDVSLYNQTIISAEQAPRIIRTAVQTALVGRGVAVITLPGDIGPLPCNAESTPLRLRNPEPQIIPSPTDLAALAGIINEVERVTILVGIGATEARQEVIDLATKLHAPMVISSKAKDVFEYDNPLHVGMTGLLGNHAAADSIDRCDLLLMIGTDFPYRDWLPNDGTKKTAQIDIAPSHIGRRCPVDVGVVGNAGPTLRSLIPMIGEKTDTSHLQKGQQDYAKWYKGQQDLARGTEGLITKAKRLFSALEEGIRPETVATMVSDMADEEAIFTADVGLCTIWAARFIEMKKGQRLLGSFNLGSMANAMPQAIGAQILYPNRQVISFSGDGGFSMLMGDFLTAVAYNLPIKIVLFNNGKLGLVKLEQEVGGMPENAVELKNPNFAAVAEAMGGTGIRIKKLEKLQEGLQTALSTEGPVLIEVLTKPGELVMPPHYTVDQAWGFAIAKVKEVVEST